MRAGRASLHEGCLVGWCSHCKCLFSPKLVPPRPSWPHRKLPRLRRSAAGLALRAGQDAAGGRAEGVPRSKCVLLEILHPHVQEQAAESLRLARYGPANGWGPGMWGHKQGQGRKTATARRPRAMPLCAQYRALRHPKSAVGFRCAGQSGFFDFCYFNSFSGLSIGLGGYLST